MEHPTRFDLKAALANWRQELAGQAELTAEVRQELETHLCDTIAGFQQQGLSAEEAFWLARRRLGQPVKLAEEFEKADPVQVWRGRLFWMWLAVFLASTLGSMFRTAASFFMPITSYASTPNKNMVLAGQLILFMLVGLIPIVIGVVLAKGKGMIMIAKLTAWLESRRRLALVGFLCIALSCAAKVNLMTLLYQRLHMQSNFATWQGLLSAIYPLILVLLLVWLLPAQPQKTPART